MGLGEEMKFQKFLCYIFGHIDIILTRIDNGCSVYGHYKCQRCKREENYQYDYLWEK